MGHIICFNSLINRMQGKVSKNSSKKGKKKAKKKQDIRHRKIFQILILSVQKYF